MSDRFCRLYTVAYDRQTILAVIDHLSSYGFALEYPGTSNIIVLDGEGSQVVKTRPELDLAFATFSSIDVLFWQTTDSNVVCWVRRVTGAMSIDFSMDGMDAEETESFAQCIISLVRTFASNGILLGLIVDHTGDYAETDWDGFFLQKKTLVGPMPAVVGVRASESIRIRGRASALSSEEINGFLILHSAQRRHHDRMP